MKCRYSLSVVMLLGVFCITPVQAAGNASSESAMQDNGIYSSQYNPWRTQAKQWRYQNNRHRSEINADRIPLHGALPPSSYALIPSRQYEYRHYVQQLKPYYEMNDGLPWWAGSGAAPYGPWFQQNGFW